MWGMSYRQKGDDDLISRAEVLNLIDELGYVNCHTGKDFEANSRVDKIRQKVVEMPTSCDVDRIIEQMKENAVSIYKDKSGEKFIWEEDAVKIVKAGGIDERDIIQGKRN